MRLELLNDTSRKLLPSIRINPSFGPTPSALMFLSFTSSGSEEFEFSSDKKIDSDSSDIGYYKCKKCGAK